MNENSDSALLSLFLSFAFFPLLWLVHLWAQQWFKWNQFFRRFKKRKIPSDADCGFSVQIEFYFLVFRSIGVLLFKLQLIRAAAPADIPENQILSLFGFFFFFVLRLFRFSYFSNWFHSIDLPLWDVSIFSRNEGLECLVGRKFSGSHLLLLRVCIERSVRSARVLFTGGTHNKTIMRGSKYTIFFFRSFVRIA